jgi:methylated-DNA-[protein]-cysteine S-methyltransferase
MTAAPPEFLALDRYTTPIGVLLIATDEVGLLRAIDLHNIEANMLPWLRAQYGKAIEIRAGAAPASITQPLDNYFAGDIGALDHIACEASGTPFQREVWTALRLIPAGKTLSYGALAHQLGRPKAMRAVGLANGSNPIPLVIPCHRVIGSNGSLTGYGGGLERKRWLLAHEGRFSPLLSG